jgi:hypothetical protein
MVGLLDLAPSTRTVRAGGGDVAVYGVSAKGIAALLTQFPNLKTLFTGGQIAMDAESIATIAPDAVSAIIAAGCGYPGDAKAIAKVDTLPVAEQAALLNAIVDLTMPEGVGPFVEALMSLMAKLNFDGPESHGKAPASNSQSPSKV